MTYFPFVRVLCLPDIDRAIGGVKQLYRHVEHLTSLGYDAAVVTQCSDFRPKWFYSTAHTVSFQEFLDDERIKPSSCILILPETYINVNLASFYGADLSSFFRVIFNQNAYYSFGAITVTHLKLVSDFYDHPLVLQVLSISEDTHSFLINSLNLSDNKVSRIVNSIEPIFKPDSNKQNIICWMPRKHSDHSQSILLSLQRSPTSFCQGWSLQPLHDLSHSDIAFHLNRSKLFLSFGHPEGFGLPVAEAMASGCWVIGYTGGGGKELFRFGASHSIPFGDWTSYLCLIKDSLEYMSVNPRESDLLVYRQSLAVRTLYSFDEEKKSIASSWQYITSSFTSALSL